MSTITLTPAQAAFLEDRPGECVAECVRDRFPELDEDIVFMDELDLHEVFYLLGGEVLDCIVDESLASSIRATTYNILS